MSNLHHINNQLNPKQELIDFVMQYIVMRKMLDFQVQVYDRDIHVYATHSMVMRIYLQYNYPNGYRIFFMVSCKDTYIHNAFKEFEEKMDELTKVKDGCDKLYSLKCSDEKEYKSLFQYILGS